MLNIDIVKLDLISQIDKRLEDNVIEPTNATLLKKLIQNAETVTEAMMIAELGTTYKRTGFHFDKRLEKMGNDIKYLKKNEELSFVNDKDKLTHKLIIGDNYDALQNLLITHRGAVDVIYIDPPYGKDDMGDFAKMNYTNAITRDNLLSMLYPRLQLSKQLLSDEGVIFCSIDDKNQAYVKGLFDEVFGEEHFVTCIPRVTKMQRSGQENYMDVSHDYILSYACCDDFLNITDRQYDESKIRTDANGTYIVGDTKAILAAQSQGYSKNGDYDFEYNGKLYSPVDTNGKRNRWLWVRERMEAAAKLGILVETENQLRAQLYIDKKFDEKTNELIPKDEKLIFHTADFMTNNIFSNSMGSNMIKSIFGDIPFSNPKPIDLIKSLLKLYSKKDAIVLDFFGGSGTTGQAVMELNREDSGNRTFILCTNNEVTDSNQNGIAVDVTSKRLKRTTSGECYDGTSNFKWLDKNEPYGDNLDVYDIETVNSSEQLSGKSPLDVIDETIYGVEKFKSVHEKIAWLCNNFENTQKYIDKE